MPRGGPTNCFCRVFTYLCTCGLLNDINCESCLIEACRCDSMSGNMYHIWIRPASFYRTLYAFEVKHFSNKPTRLMSSMHTGILLYGEFEKCYAQTVCPSVLLLFPAMCVYFQKRCLCLQQCSFISKNTASISSSAVFLLNFLDGSLGELSVPIHTELPPLVQPWLLSC